ncbi:MarR family winged helix-turn-helix transcriptional regulator [Microbispora sp. NPDC049125]|uniref:MarR family winged helix-turn-helix transcriptional regulator n=1 Tax=Microbispora sp. NPDC049125 TaxID=3154929 RepID=UPI00346728BF
MTKTGSADSFPSVQAREVSEAPSRVEADESVKVAEDIQAYHDVEHQLAVLFRRAHGISAELSRSVHSELDPGAYGLLVRICQVAPVRPSDLAAYLGVGKATVSRQLKGLEDLGLIGREPDPLDRRAHLLGLTEEGRRRLESARDARRELLHSLLSAWPEEDVRLLARMLARFNALTGSAAELV